MYSTILDNDQARLSGSWDKQDAQLQQFGFDVYTADDSGLSTSRYMPSLAYSGEYAVFMWLSPSEKQSSKMRILIHHAEGEMEVLLDGKNGKLGWRSLGIYPFQEGSSGYVELNSADDGIVIADAFKWESVTRYNDGSDVDQIALEAQDGIILIPCNPK